MDSKCKYYCYKKTRPSIKYKNNKIKNVKLVLFDMDGVLADTISSWKYVHDYFGTNNDNSVDEYLKGNIDDLEFIKRDVSLWLKKNCIIEKFFLSNILSKIKIMNGAEKCINFLIENNIKTAIVSAGIDILAERIKNQLNIDYFFANGIKTDSNGLITNEGILQVKLMYKDENVISLSKKLNIPFDNIVSIGNSCLDIPMFNYCGLSIAFNPDDICTKKAADYIIEKKDLSEVIPIVSKYI